MKKMSFALSLLLLSNIALAEKAHKHGKSQDAHVHGALKMEMAVEGKSIELDIDGPAESFIGFEYAPKTDKEKKVFLDAKDLWTKELLPKLLVIDPKLGCKITEATFKQEIDGSHSDIEAKAKIACDNDLKGQNLRVSLKRYYPHIKKLVVDLVGTETKSIEIKTDSEVIKL